jgi:hypothetical protein
MYRVRRPLVVRFDRCSSFRSVVAVQLVPVIPIDDDLAFRSAR